MGPATFRRGVVLTKLGRRPNPFPLVKLPYHRLVCPWTLGAIPHEIGHNLQSDLGLWRKVPAQIDKELAGAGAPATIRRVWGRWHKEIFADLIGVLLIGPAFVGSLMDVVAKSPEQTSAFKPAGVHPTPFLRVLMNVELLRRIGFADEAEAYRRAWLTIYPPALARNLPTTLAQRFPEDVATVISAIVFTPYRALGGKRLADVIAFRPQDQLVATEAAGRLASEHDPGIVPERFLIPAARIAFDGGFAPPDTIARNFYAALGRR
jgi:hypothetical protein